MSKRTTKKPKPCYVWVPMEPDGTLWPLWARKTRKDLARDLAEHIVDLKSAYCVIVRATPVRCEVRPVKKGKR